MFLEMQISVFQERLKISPEMTSQICCLCAPRLKKLCMRCKKVETLFSIQKQTIILQFHGWSNLIRFHCHWLSFLASLDLVQLDDQEFCFHQGLYQRWTAILENPILSTKEEMEWTTMELRKRYLRTAYVLIIYPTTWT